MSLTREGVGKTALITGADSFTGQYVARELLAAGYRVIGTTSSGQGNLPFGTQIRKLELIDRIAIRILLSEARPDVVVHLETHPKTQSDDIEKIYTVDIAWTSKLLEELDAISLKRPIVMIISDASVYGNSSHSVIDEQVEISPLDDFSVSKISVEHIAKIWMDRIHIIIVRPFNYSGLGQHPSFFLPKIVDSFQRREASIRLPQLNIKRDFSDVRLVAAAYRALLYRAPESGVYNVCSGIAYSLEDIHKTMETIADFKINLIETKALKLPEVIEVQIGNNNRLENVIGKIIPIPLEKTLRWMYTNGSET